jgi:hypothetical protein
LARVERIGQKIVDPPRVKVADPRRILVRKSGSFASKTVGCDAVPAGVCRIPVLAGERALPEIAPAAGVEKWALAALPFQRLPLDSGEFVHVVREWSGSGRSSAIGQALQAIKTTRAAFKEAAVSPLEILAPGEVDLLFLDTGLLKLNSPVYQAVRRGSEVWRIVEHVAAGCAENVALAAGITLNGRHVFTSNKADVKVVASAGPVVKSITLSKAVVKDVASTCLVLKDVALCCSILENRVTSCSAIVKDVALCCSILENRVTSCCSIIEDVALLLSHVLKNVASALKRIEVGIERSGVGFMKQFRPEFKRKDQNKQL